jgi:hypothetical protein
MTTLREELELRRKTEIHEIEEVSTHVPLFLYNVCLHMYVRTYVHMCAYLHVYLMHWNTYVHTYIFTTHYMCI